MEMKVAVILSEAKDLQFRSGELMQILRFAQNDRLSRGRSEESRSECVRQGEISRRLQLLAMTDAADFSASCQKNPREKRS